MKSLHLAFLLIVASFAGCQLQTSQTEQRVVELPADKPDATLQTAEKIGQALIAGGLMADVQKQFPGLTPQQLSGVYVTWNAGDIKGKNRFFFLTGINYTGTLLEAKAVADYCEWRLQEAVKAHFAPPESAAKPK
jgi:hypothetical protein